MQLTELSDGGLVRIINSNTCPACGGWKKKGQTFCGTDYFRLSKRERLALYDRLGEGYAEAVSRACQVLGVDDFKMPHGQEAQ